MHGHSMNQNIITSISESPALSWSLHDYSQTAVSEGILDWLVMMKLSGDGG